VRIEGRLSDRKEGHFLCVSGLQKTELNAIYLLGRSGNKDIFECNGLVVVEVLFVAN